MQLKREAKLLAVIGLTTMHAVCRITFMLYPIFLYLRMIFTKLGTEVIASIYFSESIHCHHKILVPTGLVAEEILVQH